MTTSDEKIKALTESEQEKLLGKEVFRARTNEIIREHLASVDFMMKVREYARMEIDTQLFTSIKYWATLVLTAIITSGIGVVLSLYFTKSK